LLLASVCPDLTIRNGHIKVKVNVNNKMARYYCNEGFTLAGSPLRTCQDNGWSGIDPVCRCKTQDISSLLIMTQAL